MSATLVEAERASMLIGLSKVTHVSRQATPLGFDWTLKGGVTIHRALRWGSRPATHAHRAAKRSRQPTPGIALPAYRASLTRSIFNVSIPMAFTASQLNSKKQSLEATGFRNGSHPSHSETNSRSGAAGSRR